jgi:phage shock protein C
MTCVCGNTIHDGAAFCSRCGRPVTANGQQSRLERPRVGRKIAGVCVGIAAYTGWDVTLVRVVAVLSVFLGVGMPLLAYVIGWVVMPEGPLMLMPVSAAPPAYAPPAYTPPAYTPPAGDPGATL